jgi:hypothetical protein
MSFNPLLPDVSWNPIARRLEVSKTKPTRQNMPLDATSNLWSLAIRLLRMMKKPLLFDRSFPIKFKSKWVGKWRNSWTTWLKRDEGNGCLSQSSSQFVTLLDLKMYVISQPNQCFVSFKNVIIAVHVQTLQVYLGRYSSKARVRIAGDWLNLKSLSILKYCRFSRLLLATYSPKYSTCITIYIQYAEIIWHKQILPNIIWFTVPSVPDFYSSSIMFMYLRIIVCKHFWNSNKHGWEGVSLRLHSFFLRTLRNGFSCWHAVMTKVIFFLIDSWCDARGAKGKSVERGGSKSKSHDSWLMARAFG